MQREGGEMATRTLRIWEKELPKKRGESEVTFRTNIKERGADKTTHHSAITINTANIFNGITQHNFSKSGNSDFMVYHFDWKHVGLCI